MRGIFQLQRHNPIPICMVRPVSSGRMCLGGPVLAKKSPPAAGSAGSPVTHIDRFHLISKFNLSYSIEHRQNPTEASHVARSSPGSMTLTQGSGRLGSGSMRRVPVKTCSTHEDLVPSGKLSVWLWGLPVSEARWVCVGNRVTSSRKGRAEHLGDLLQLPGQHASPNSVEPGTL